MPRLSVLSAAFALFGGLATSASSEVRAQLACAYVAGPGTLTAIDLPSAEFAYRIPFGRIWPDALAVSPQYGLAFVAGRKWLDPLDRWGFPLPEGSDEVAWSGVVAVDLSSGRTTELAMQGADSLLVDPTGRRLLVARAGDSRIFSLPWTEESASVAVPNLRAAVFSDDGAQLFLATAEAAQRIVIVDTESGSVERELTLPNSLNVAGMVKVNGERTLILQPERTAALLELDLATGVLGSSLSFEGDAYWLRFDGALRVPLLAAAYRPAGKPPRLQFIDGSSLEVMAQIDPALETLEGSIGTVPFDVAVSAGGEFVVLTGETSFYSIPEDPVVHASFSVHYRTNDQSVSVHRPSVGPFGRPHVALFPQPCPELAPCAGDCDGDHRVNVDELVVLVNIVMRRARARACLAGDQSGDGVITVDEVIGAVSRALDGC